MKVKEVITVQGWIDGSGWSYSTVYDTNEIDIEKSDLERPNIDWSWFDADGAEDGEDTEITVSWYPIDGDEDTKPIVEWTTWASELVEV